MRWTMFSFALLVVTIPHVLGGCTFNLGLDRLASAVGTVQTTDPRDADLPDELVDEGDTVVIDADVNVIVDIEEDLAVIELPDSTVIGFDNQTGWDIYVQFLADGEPQGVYVFDGETLLLDYPCLGKIELLWEDDIDPFSGVVVDSFELGELYLNPEDFFCGDAIIFPFEADTVEIVVEYIDLDD